MSHTCYELALIDTSTNEMVKVGFFSEPIPSPGDKNLYRGREGHSLIWCTLNTTSGSSYQEAKKLAKKERIRKTIQETDSE